jgi:hypothetical protein
MRAHEKLELVVNGTGASTTPAIYATGGLYKLLLSGTVGSSKIEVEDPAGNWVAVGAALVTLVSQDIYLPPGQIRANMGAGASGAYVHLVRVPIE